MTYRFANSAFEGYLSGARTAHWTVFRRGYRVDDGRPSGLDLNLLDEGVDEGFGLGQLAGGQELAHLLGEGGDGVG